MTRSDLEEIVESRLPEFYKLLLGDAEVVLMHQTSFSDDEITLLGAAVKLAGYYDKDVTVITRSTRDGHMQPS